MSNIAWNVPQSMLDNLNAPRPYAEYPKMLHGAGGVTLLVASAEEEAAAGPGWFASPDAAAAPVRVTASKRR